MDTLPDRSRPRGHLPPLKAPASANKPPKTETVDGTVSAEFEYKGNKYRNAAVVAQDEPTEKRSTPKGTPRSESAAVALRRRRKSDETATDSPAGSNASDDADSSERKKSRRRKPSKRARKSDDRSHSFARGDRGSRGGSDADVDPSEDAGAKMDVDEAEGRNSRRSRSPQLRQSASRRTASHKKSASRSSRNRSKTASPDFDNDVSMADNPDIPQGASTPADRSLDMDSVTHDEPSDKEDNENDGRVRSESKPLRMFCATWNMHDEKPPSSIAALLRPHEGEQEDCDVYAVGVQEQSWQQRQWEAALHAELGPEYILLHSHAMLAIHLAVFVRKPLLRHISDVESAHVSTGIANVVGNKGGVGIAFTIFGTKLLFINCHLAAHQHKAEERNKDYRRIVREMPLPHKRVVRKALSISGTKDREEDVEGARSKQRDVTTEYDVAFFFGDLNYRINGTRRLVDALVDNAMREVMLSNDQLSHARIRGSSFWGFTEPHIEFPPTFKYDLDKDDYDTSGKVRIPSWTDRILTRDNSVAASASAGPSAAGDTTATAMDSSAGDGRHDGADGNLHDTGHAHHSHHTGLRGHRSLITPGQGRLRPVAYNCCQSFRMSDHRPVYAINELDVSWTKSGPKGSKTTQTSVCAIL
eukprot:Opistho-2@26529